MIKINSRKSSNNSLQTSTHTRTTHTKLTTHTYGQVTTTLEVERVVKEVKEKSSKISKSSKRKV